MGPFSCMLDSDNIFTSYVVLKLSYFTSKIWIQDIATISESFFYENESTMEDKKEESKIGQES